MTSGDELAIFTPRHASFDPDFSADAIADLCRRFEVERLEVFGSATRDDFDEETSDIDFIVRAAVEAERQTSMPGSLNGLTPEQIEIIAASA